MKKALAVIFVILTLASVVVFPVSATLVGGSIGYTGVSWSLDTQTTDLIISGAGSVPGYELFEGNPVGVPWYRYKDYITTVTVTESVRAIGAHAFDGCDKLVAVHILNSSTKIGDGNERFKIKMRGHEVEHTPRVEAVCSAEGLFDGREEGWYCKGCEKYVYGGKVIVAAHKDYRKDGQCDVCNHIYCPHKCHQNLSGIKKFFWDFELFFWKLFKMNRICECGAAHY